MFRDHWHTSSQRQIANVFDAAGRDPTGPIVTLPLNNGVTETWTLGTAQKQPKALVGGQERQQPAEPGLVLRPGCEQQWERDGRDHRKHRPRSDLWSEFRVESLCCRD